MIRSGAIPNPREHFALIARAADAQIDLGEAALVIAAEEYPSLDVSAYLACLDELGRSARAALRGAQGLQARVACLNRFLFEDQGFAGNRDEYYDPGNSYFNDVLDRHSGIPISLSSVYVEVARRAGLDARGVSFPGHFLLKVAESDQEIVVDAFSQTVLTPEECRGRLDEALGGSARFDPRVHLRAATNREILVRMLSNLKHIQLRARDYGRALGCCERILLLIPDAPVELRDRGAVYDQLECYAASLADLERFVKLAPEDESVPAVRMKIAELRAKVPLLH